MPKKICVSHTGLDNKQRKDLQSRIKKTVDDFDTEIKDQSEEPEQEEE